MHAFQSVGVIGAGAWGTALAGVAARAGRKVVLYARNADHRRADAGDAHQSEPARRAPGRPHRGDQPRSPAAASADIILIATPAQNLREAAARIWRRI